MLILSSFSRNFTDKVFIEYVMRFPEESNKFPSWFFQDCQERVPIASLVLEKHPLSPTWCFKRPTFLRLPCLRVLDRNACFLTILSDDTFLFLYQPPTNKDRNNPSSKMTMSVWQPCTIGEVSRPCWTMSSHWWLTESGSALFPSSSPPLYLWSYLQCAFA